MRVFVIGLLTLIVALTGQHLASPERADGASCGSDSIRISGATAQEAELACAGIADAIGFFAARGFATDIAIDVSVDEDAVTVDDGGLAFPVLGRFHPDDDRIIMTSLASQRAMAQDRPAFRMPFAAAQFREVVAHETAHALAERNFSHADPSRLVHEYIAYIVQMATMAPTRRAAILGNYATGPFETVLEINPMVYGIAPDVFAVKAWLYFVEQPDGAAYLRRIMAEDLPAAAFTFDVMG